MFRKAPVILISLAFAVSLAAAADVTPAGAKLSAAEIADKNVAARGGLQAWRAVHTMSLAGKLGAGGNQRATLQVAPPVGAGLSAGAPQRSTPQAIPGTTRPVQEVQLPFLMELARPRKMRFELQFNGDTAIQVFDGANGWKLRPFLNRRVVEPYTDDEMKTTSRQADLDGPLLHGVDQLHPLAMPLLNTISRQEHLDDGRRLLEIRLPRTERQHVGVVVLAAVLGQRDAVTGRRPHAEHLVGSHRRADAGAVDHDAAVALPAGHQPRHRVSDARVIHRILAMGPAILNRAPFIAQPAQKLRLQLESAVVGADGNLEILHAGKMAGCSAFAAKN